jgi:predicted nucleic acid-binding Zn ribbon protein
MKCVYCGAEIQVGMRFCGLCGKLVVQETIDKAKTVEKDRHCVKCGRSIEWTSNICPYCGYDFKAPQSPVRNASIGGILVILASIVSLFFLAYFYLTTHQSSYYYSSINYDWMVYIFFVGMAVMGLFGGIAALGRVYYSVAVVGAACSILGPGFFFGIPGLSIIINSAREFPTEPKHTVNKPPQN